jgi:hypothetical protein
MKINVVWDPMPCGLVDRCLHFRGTFYLHLQGGRFRMCVLKIEAARSSETLLHT